MRTRIIRTRDLVQVPWKNQGGTTAQIAVAPKNAGFDDFDWRLAMADVRADGPFSPFPGVCRTLVLIEGQELEVTVGGVAHRLAGAGAMLGFAGEAVTTARLPAGPIRDLNVMTRRGRYEHDVEVVGPGPSKKPSRPASLMAIVALEGPVRVETDTGPCLLDRFDVLLAEPAAPVEVDAPALLIWLRSADPAAAFGSDAELSKDPPAEWEAGGKTVLNPEREE